MSTDGEFLICRVSPTQVAVRTPYNPVFVQWCRDHKGQWDGKIKAWVFTVQPTMANQVFVALQQTVNQHYNAVVLEVDALPDAPDKPGGRGRRAWAHASGPGTPVELVGGGVMGPVMDVSGPIVCGQHPNVPGLAVGHDHCPIGVGEVVTPTLLLDLATTYLTSKQRGALGIRLMQVDAAKEG